MILKYGDTGQSVKDLQVRLNHNDYRHPRRLLDVDGEFGPLTAASVQGTKFWMGYPKTEMEAQAGEKFMRFITEAEPLPGEYRQRRTERLAAVAAGPGPEAALRLRALVAAKADVGTVEGPGNEIKYNSWWCDGGNDHGAYCVRAGAFWYVKAGSTAWERGRRWENTDALLADAQAGRNGVHITSDPESGVGFVIDFDGHSDPDHFGLYVASLAGGQFRSLEANATLPSGRQGVGMHVRAYHNCWFIETER